MKMKDMKSKGSMVKVAIGNEAIKRAVKGQQVKVSGGEKTSSCVPMKGAKTARPNPAPKAIAKPLKSKAALTADEAFMAAWNHTYTNRKKRVA